MSNLRSFVGQTVQVQLPHLAHIRPLVPFFAAIIVFSSVPVVGRGSPTSVSVFPTTLRNTLMKSSISDGIPLLKSLFNLFTHTLNTACLRVRVHIKLPVQWQQMFHHGRTRSRGDDTSATSRAEAQYWRAADRYRRRLYSGNGSPPNISTTSRDSTDVSLVTYYTPRLLPLYRGRRNGRHTSREMNMEAQEGRISPRTFCKWHRMVFPDSCHPTLAQATIQMKYYSNRDLREIQRIARLLPDSRVFDLNETWRARKATKYKQMWQSWLENKGMDLVIVFE